MFFRMMSANVRVGREEVHGMELDYFQIEVDGKLEINSRYGSAMSSDLMDKRLIPIGFVRYLSTRGLSDYNLVNGEIMDENNIRKTIQPRSRIFIDQLKGMMNNEFKLVTMGN